MNLKVESRREHILDAVEQIELLLDGIGIEALASDRGL